MIPFPPYDGGAAQQLAHGAIGVFPTETIYGIGTSATNQLAVEKIFVLKKRPAHKPFAILVADISEITQFGISLKHIKRAEPYWPGPFTVILPSTDTMWQYLHRDSGGLSFRVPAEPHFRDFLRVTGPLAVTSANLAGEPTITSPEQAYAIFGDEVAVYMQKSPWASQHASSVVDCKTTRATIVRK